MKNPVYQFIALLSFTLSLSLLPTEAAVTAAKTAATPTTIYNTAITAGDTLDLIESGKSTLASQSASNPATGGGGDNPIINPAGINDGSADIGALAYNLRNDAFVPQYTAYFTFNLNTAAAPGGYNLSALTLYSGYDGGFDYQDFDIYVKTTKSNGTFVQVVNPATAMSGGDFSNFTGTNGDPSGLSLGEAESTTITNTSLGSYVAGNVTAIELVSFQPDVLKEFQVFGTAATIPEPSTYAMLLGGLALLVARLRRRTV